MGSAPLIFHLHDFAGRIAVIANEGGLTVRSDDPSIEIGKRESWPAESIAAPGAWKAAIEIEQLLELGLAAGENRNVVVPFENFDAVEEAEIGLTSAWVPGSPFILRIDRQSDLGRPDFRYKYEFITSARPVYAERLGYYIRQIGDDLVFRLDRQAYALVEAMDRFNALPESAKTQEESWLTFAKVKGCAEEVGAQLDRTLRSNAVVVPSSIGLDIYEDQSGAITFLPRCPELDNADFRNVFERNDGAQGLYSLDRPGLGRVRIVLTDKQQEVLKRMKRVRRLTGPQTISVRDNPSQVFDGLLDSVELPYSERVIGIGDFQFVPTPKAAPPDGGMAPLWKNTEPAVDESVDAGSSLPTPEQSGDTAALPGIQSHDAGNDGQPGPLVDAATQDPPALGDELKATSEVSPRNRNFLLIETNEDSVRAEAVANAERAALDPAVLCEFERPKALRTDLELKPHQIDGVCWLQTCCRIDDRSGVLLADDMGLGKTLQVLAFLAWAIESGRFPDVAADTPPYRPILVIVPLILLENRTWELEMERFFEGDGSIFTPILNLHGERLRWLRADADRPGKETEIGRPMLDLDRIQRYRVVITNYETITNYQHSFAYIRNGKPLWSAIVTDEAQEYKTPNTKISHAIKAIKADFEVASTGTPVENRLLDLWNLFDSIQPGLLRSAQEFRKQYEDPVAAGKQDVRLGDLKRTLLFQRPHAFLLRRNKSEVTTLPAKQIVKLNCPMSAREVDLHRQLIRCMRTRTGKSHHLAVLHDFNRLYQHPALLGSDAEDEGAADLLAGSSKLRSVIDVVHGIKQKREKAIIFTRHRAMQSVLAKVLQAEFGIPIRIINGLTQRSQLGMALKSASSRKAILEEFRSRSGFNVLILSPHVAGVGLTITEANHVIHYGRWWNPAVESQATDRVYRIGQSKDVHVYLPILRDPSGVIQNTFDERLDALMETKYRIAEDFLKPLDTEDELGNALCAQLETEGAQSNAD
jgi:hypothetical protein